METGCDEGINWAVDGHPAYHVKSRSFLAGLRGCKTLGGSVYIDYEADTPFDKNSSSHAEDMILDLGSITHIRGSLDIHLSKWPITKVYAPYLEEIEGRLYVHDCPQLEQIIMPQLAHLGRYASLSTGGGMKLADLPKLRAMQVASQGVMTYFKGQYSESVDVEIARTRLETLSFLRSVRLPGGFYSQQFKAFKIDSNHELKEIDLPGWNDGIELLRISDNHPLLAISMTNLSTVVDMQINNAKGIFLPKLKNATGSIDISNNTIEVMDFPNLISVVKNISVTDNSRLFEIHFSHLKDVGGNIWMTGNFAK